MLTQEELKNLEIIFALARQASVQDENQLIGVINFKKALFDKLNGEKGSESKVVDINKEPVQEMDPITAK